MILITSAIIVTQELEDRTAVTLLSKPLHRSDFLLGKYLGLIMALAAAERGEDTGDVFGFSVGGT